MDDKNWFSAQQLSKLGLKKVIDFPRTERNSREKARKLGWSEKEIPCRGGKNGYMAVFKPPVNILNQILNAIDNEPGFFDDVYVPKNLPKPYPTSTAAPLKLVTGDGHSNQLTIGNNSVTEIKVNNFAIMPKNALQTVTQQGHNQTIYSNQIVDYLAFNKEWLDMSMDVRNNCLALITVKDDSMEPTLRSDDLILTDVRRSELENNALYVLQFDNDLIVKRIQKKINGNVIVKSDNPNYADEELDQLTAQSLHVVGKVILYVRRI